MRDDKRNPRCIPTRIGTGTVATRLMENGSCTGALANVGRGGDTGAGEGLPEQPLPSKTHLSSPWRNPA